MSQQWSVCFNGQSARLPVSLFAKYTPFSYQSANYLIFKNFFFAFYLIPGFAGTRCERRINECASNPCQNGATCQQILDGVGFSCYCAVGYTGPLCQTMLSYCLVGLCKNGGSCHEKRPGGYQCECAPGYTGVDCSIIVDK